MRTSNRRASRCWTQAHASPRPRVLRPVALPVSLMNVMTTPTTGAIAAPSSHVRLDDEGVAWIDRTNVKVIEVVLDRVAHGWSAEEVHFQHPNLSLAQIHGALAWYYDHQAELDAEIERRFDDAEAERARVGESPLRRRLRVASRPA